MKATAKAPANIAFIKYWGKRNEELRLPENGSLSMNLSTLLTTTTVDFDSKYAKDQVTINGVSEPEEVERASKHLDRIRRIADISERAKVVSINSFPKSVGLSSAASGFAALTVAAVAAARLKLSQKELSILARLGSGSACRSIPDGFVEWLDGPTSETSYAVSLYPENYWKLIDVVAIVSEEAKDITSTVGHTLSHTSPFYKQRLTCIKDKIALTKKFLAERNFPKFGELCEAEALELHAIMLTSQPSLIYWTSGTLKLMRLTKIWRSEGLPVYFTINTGQNIHLLCEAKNDDAVTSKLKEISEVKNIIVNYPAKGAHLVDEHLF